MTTPVRSLFRLVSLNRFFFGVVLYISQHNEDIVNVRYSLYRTMPKLFLLNPPRARQLVMTINDAARQLVMTAVLEMTDRMHADLTY